MKKLIVCVWIFAGVLGYGIELQEMFELAVENDRQLAILETSLENTQLRIAKSRLEPPLQFSAGLGISGGRLTYSLDPGAGEPTALLSASPSVSLGLGDPWETSMGLAVPFSVSFGEDVSSSFSPAFTLTQPLDPLFGAEDSSAAQELEDFYALEQGRIDIFLRSSSVQSQVLQELRLFLQLEKDREELQWQIETARAALDEAAALGTYSTGSSAYQQLELNLAALNREKEANDSKHRRAWDRLEAMVGVELETLSQLPANVPLELPVLSDPDRSPAVYLALIDKRIEELKLREVELPDPGEFSVGGSYTMELTDFSQAADHELSATLTGEYENLSFSTTLGGALDSKDLFLTFGLSWSLPDGRAEQITRQEYQNNLFIADLRLEEAELAYWESLADLEERIEEIEDRGQGLLEQKYLAELTLAEVQARYDEGLVSDRELEEARWNSDRLIFDEQMLSIDRLLVQKTLDELLLPGEGGI
jgi:hypothetical protein